MGSMRDKILISEFGVTGAARDADAARIRSASRVSVANMPPQIFHFILQVQIFILLSISYTCVQLTQAV